MSTATVTYPARTAAPALQLYWKETKYEFYKLFRTRSFTVSVIAFPVMFYIIFGLANRGVIDSGVNVAKHMLAGYACFGMVGAALFGIGVGLASERAMGWLEVKRASPMPAAAYLLAKCLTAIAFGWIIESILIAIATSFGGVTLSLQELAGMYAVTVAGATTFASMGLLLALVMPANAASGIVNLIYLPMSFLSGLWMPVKYMHPVLQKIAPLLPTYHLAQLMLACFGYRDSIPMATHWSALAGFTCLMLGISMLVFNRKQENS